MLHKVNVLILMQQAMLKCDLNGLRRRGSV